MAETVVTGNLGWLGTDGVVATSKDLGASWDSDAVFLGRHTAFSFDIVWLGADPPVGEFKLQGSNGAAWQDIPRSTLSVNGAGSEIFNVTNRYCEKVRLVYTRTSGGSGDIVAGKWMIK